VQNVVAGAANTFKSRRNRSIRESTAERGCVRLQLSFVILMASIGILTQVRAAADEPAHARNVIAAAARALGGADRIRAVRNITLIGYGQYAYMFGGGNITGSPNAPQKYQAANDLRRVYDLENGRYQQLERRNFLFPFAAIFGHSYAMVDEVLDGDIAYDIAPDGALRRVPRWNETSHQVDGVHMRRMWALNNPIVAIRAALSSGTKIGLPRMEGDVIAIEMALREGDKFTLGFDRQSSLPLWVRWANPQANLGQVTFTTYFTGFVPYGGLLLPLGYRTTMDWREIEYLKLFVDNYVIDSEITNLAAAPAMRQALEPEQSRIEVTSTRVAKGIWRLMPYGATVFEFNDHLAVFELGGSQANAQAIINYAKSMVPGKPITQYIPSHHHFDHTAGLRVAIAEGLTVISRRGNEEVFREMATHPSPDFPDALEKNKKPMKFVGMDEHLSLSDSLMTVDLYWARNNIHMADAVFAYVPAAKVMAEGDIGTAAFDYQFWGDNFMDNVEHYKLDVETVSPVHMDIMKRGPLIEMIKGGVRRARERCAAELAKGDFFPGCPIQSTRY
jgi:hypothetical protein